MHLNLVYHNRFCFKRNSFLNFFFSFFFFYLQGALFSSFPAKLLDLFIIINKSRLIVLFSPFLPRTKRSAYLFCPERSDPLLSTRLATTSPDWYHSPLGNVSTHRPFFISLFLNYLCFFLHKIKFYYVKKHKIN